MAVEVVGMDQAVYKQCTCRNCAAVLRYTPNDVRSEIRRDYTGCADTYRSIQCPRCLSQVSVQ